MGTSTNSIQICSLNSLTKMSYIYCRECHGLSLTDGRWTGRITTDDTLYCTSYYSYYIRIQKGKLSISLIILSFSSSGLAVISNSDINSNLLHPHLYKPWLCLLSRRQLLDKTCLLYTCWLFVFSCNAW